MCMYIYMYVLVFLVFAGSFLTPDQPTTEQLSVSQYS